ncbi:hypothetical protein [Solibacillus ferritrahens]
MNKLIAKQIPHTFELHGDVRHDEYYWMKDKYRSGSTVCRYCHNDA